MTTNLIDKQTKMLTSTGMFAQPLVSITTLNHEINKRNFFAQIKISLTTPVIGDHNHNTINSMNISDWRSVI